MYDAIADYNEAIRLNPQDEQAWCNRGMSYGNLGNHRKALKNFEEAIRLANSVAFGLTGGIHSLDHREIELYKEQIEVGNVYVNRPITGAIVRRQPIRKNGFGLPGNDQHNTRR